jgi:ParB family chromosome partitioning protein
MRLEHIPLEQLKLSNLNVRKKGGKEVADLIPSIRSLGIVQPLLVRPNCEGFEIVAGQRRYHAAVALAEEGFAEPLPCLIMEEGEDAKAIEASLAENIARLPMDEIDQYKAFAHLRGEGLDAAEIASRFGVTERLVQQRLAIAGIIEPILNAYRRDEIDAETLRILTMATAKQQKAWWKLFRDEEDCAPTGWRLKEWLFGGSQIPVSNALFDPAGYTGAIVSDLFGEERYFADASAFWELQGSAIAEKREAYLAESWAEVVVLDTGQRFATWEHEKVAKKKGGKVFVAITHNGEVAFHEGWLSMKEAKKLRRAEQKEQDGSSETAEGGPPISAKPELTAKMRNYIGLHKHAAVRTELLAHPSIALRLAVAHMIAGSGLWKVAADDQRAEGNAIAESLAASQAEAGFAEERGRIRVLLGIEADEAEDATIVPRQRDWGSHRSLPDIFECLMHMEDATLLRILAFVMAETLEAQSHVVERLGALLATDMRGWWQPDEIFFELLRDKAAVNAMLREVAGDVTADAHIASTAKVQKKIIADCLSGNGREKVEGWLPRYMAFPEGSYTERGERNTIAVPDVDDDAGPDAYGGSVEDEDTEAA